MKNGFAHFDRSHQENFCAAVLLLAMEVDGVAHTFVADLVRRELALPSTSKLVDFGREARLAHAEDENYARVDLWLRFTAGSEEFYAFLEVKTHDRWDAAHVCAQVRDQAQRELVRGHREIRGVLLLAPGHLCKRVREIDASVRSVTWPRLLEEMRALRSASALTTMAIQHLEENMDRSIGLERELSLKEFEQAMTIVSCLRQLLLGCIADVGGRVQGEPVSMTPGDGRPLKGGGWAWHGLSVPFSLAGEKGRLGMYKYSETPAGEEANQATLWIEAYLGDGDTPLAASPFKPDSLRPEVLAKVRLDFVGEWTQKLTARSGGESSE